MFVGGKGGVGKTTCAAAWAIGRAERGHRVLVASTDPAHSLGDVVGVRLTGVARRIGGVRGGLDAVELDAVRALRRWLARRRPALETILLRGTFLDEDDVTRLLRLSLPGSDELMALLELDRLTAGDAPGSTEAPGAYDEIVVDMAPTGHALRLLDVPDAQKRVAALFHDMLARHRVVVTHLRGSYREDVADAVVRELAALGRRWRSILRDPARAEFRWVTLPEPVAVAETRAGLAALRRQRLPVTALIVNRLTPAPDTRCDDCAARRRSEATVLRQLRSAHHNLSIRYLPAADREPRGVARLRTLGRHLTGPRWRPGRPPTEAARRPRPAHARTWPLDLPPGVRLVAFVGKGGVGKTTCAAAAAAALAEAPAGRRLLLLSVDPAHSVGDVLDLRVGDRGRTTRMGRGTVHVRELDALQVFRSHLAEYRRQIEDSLKRADEAGGLEVGDGKLIGRLFDLAPPGVDEVLGILVLLDALGLAGPPTARRPAQRRGSRGRDVFDLVVLDTAPTGHLIRLLETVRETQRWVRALLALLLKYRDLLRLGETAARLLDVSRGLTALHDLLTSPQRTAFIVVTQSSSVVRAETDRLVGRLRRLRIPVRAVVVNGLTAGTCAACRRRRARERREVVRVRRLCRAARPRCATLVTPLVAPAPRGPVRLLAWSRRWEEA